MRVGVAQRFASLILLFAFAFSHRLARSAIVRSEQQHQHGVRGGTDVLDEAGLLLRSQPSPPRPRPRLSGAPGGEPMRVAFAVFLTDLRSKAYEDAVAVLAHSIHVAAARSKHHVEVVALTPKRFSKEAETSMKRAGIEKVLRYPLLVPTDAIEKEEVREAQRKRSSDGSFQFAEEQIKYWGLHLTDYDRVLVLDADTLVLDPMDELMGLDEDFVGTYDHGLDVSGSISAPVQGGFLLFRPNASDLREIRQVTREGDFRYDGSGWHGSGIGFAYGGTGPDGMLAYFYQRGALRHMKKVGKAHLPETLGAAPVAGSRMRAVDRSVYDIVLNKRLKSEVDGLDHDQVLRRAKSVHFTGDCPKPWSCHDSEHWLCAGLQQRWWELRADLEAKRGLPPSHPGCQGDKYEPLAAAATAAA